VGESARVAIACALLEAVAECGASVVAAPASVLVVADGVLLLRPVAVPARSVVSVIATLVSSVEAGAGEWLACLVAAPVTGDLEGLDGVV
jgi:hypothetical protein